MKRRWGSGIDGIFGFLLCKEKGEMRNRRRWAVGGREARGEQKAEVDEQEGGRGGDGGAEGGGGGGGGGGEETAP